MKKTMFIALVILFGLPLKGSADLNQIIVIDATTCKMSEVKIVQTPFTLDLFCEDALGAYIGIAYRGIMGASRSSGWAIDERYWQVKDWSSDVKSILPIRGGKEMLVSTSGVYGTPGIYLLRLLEKKWEKIYEPRDKGEHSFVIRDFLEKSNKLVFQDESSKNLKQLEIRINK